MKKEKTDKPFMMTHIKMESQKKAIEVVEDYAKKHNMETIQKKHDDGSVTIELAGKCVDCGMFLNDYGMCPDAPRDLVNCGYDPDTQNS